MTHPDLQTRTDSVIATHNTRRGFLKAVGLGAAAMAARRAGAGRKPATPKPNIIFVMVDDLGPEWISCCGGEGVKTPAIDKLAAGGMRFTNAYSMPKCTPTRACLLTGQYPFRNGWVNHWDVPRWGAGCHFDWKHNVSFARVMKSARYATAAAGKWQVNDFRVHPDAMKKHGFDEWCMWTGYETGNPPSGKRYWDVYINTPTGSKTCEGKFGAEVFTDFLIDFMKRHKDEPMMLYFPMALTHGPLVATPLARDAASKMDKHKAMVLYVDHCMDRLVKALDELKIRNRTILIFTTDNGTSGGIRGRLNGREVSGGKGKLSETGCRAPFIVNGPSLVPKGVVTDTLTDFSDMLPTFAELGGAQLPKGVTLDGKSIAKVILGKAADGERQWIMAMGGGVAKITDKGVIPAKPYAARVIRDKRYKLWVDNNGRGHKLFDLQADPGETNNIFDSDDAKVAAARKKLTAAAATFPEKDAAPKYDPAPPQAWDRKPGGGTGKSRKKNKAGRKKARQGAAQQ